MHRLLTEGSTQLHTHELWRRKVWKCVSVEMNQRKDNKNRHPQTNKRLDVHADISPVTGGGGGEGGGVSTEPSGSIRRVNDSAE